MEGGGSNAISIIPAQQILKFLHHVIDNLCGGRAVSHELCKECPLDKFWLAVKQAKAIVQDVTIGKLTEEEVINLLLPFGEELAKNAYEAICARKEEIRESLLRAALQDTHHLKDFDWNVRLAVSSDKVLDLSESLLTLHLHSSSLENRNADNLSVEMTATQVDALLDCLKAAQEIINRQQFE
ncbi:COMM domain-containing protein 8-like [Panulirus ornatus]|uniref:COMM domain-containing protein 8-like n=1 Tax=Panulirus ornatus TaxID=150431 RepID=UPI003A837AF7